MKNRKVILTALCIIVCTAALVFAGRNVSGILQKTKTPCRQTDAAQKKQCQVREVEKSLIRPDFARAWLLISQFSGEDPAFAETCHGLTHSIGQKAYALFARGKTVPVTKETAYCSYGFFHGFMETLLKDNQPAQKAQEFCDDVARQTKESSPDARYACYHGIGHGWANVHDEQLFGNERAIVLPALALCRQIAVEKEQLLRCATGVFDSVSIAYYNKENGLVMKKNDPLWLCREQEEGVFKDACYRDMMPAILWLGEYSLATSVPYVIRFVPTPYADPAIKTLASDSVRYTIGKTDDWQSVSLSVCRSLRGDLRVPCVNGLATGMMEFGKPEKAHELALSFCRRKELSDPERETCFDGVVRFVVTRYEKSSAAAVCRTIEPQYQGTCERMKK